MKRDFSFGNPTVRAWIYQFIAVVAVLGVVGYLVHNTIINLANRGITSGFGFLERTAGFGIVQHLIEYTEGDTYARVFLVGLTSKVPEEDLQQGWDITEGFDIDIREFPQQPVVRKAGKTDRESENRSENNTECRNQQRVG